MSTNNNVIVPNFAPASSTADFNTIWKLTRALKKAGYKYMGSGDGTNKDNSTDPAADKWGGGVTTNAGAAAASIAAPTRGRATVTGLTGIVSADKGRFLLISGAATGANNHQHQIEEVISATSVRIDARNFAVASDANNGSLTWSVKDALSDTYPSALDTVAAWWCGRGPSVLKIPITAAPVVGGSSGLTFVRGENIVQASTGFEGEILGFVFDGASTGYLVVIPRLRGTGAGVYGLTTANAFTGDVSGATVTQNGTGVEYRHEIVFWKQTNTHQGQLFIQCYDPVGESANAFSGLVGSAGCTSTVAPGGGGTGNAFPTIAYVVLGNTTNTANIDWNGSSTTSGFGNAQIMVADCIEEQHWSLDGSFVWALANTGVNGGTYFGGAFQRCDDSEDGDLDPYVTLWGDGTTLYTATSRTVTVQATATDFFSASTTMGATTSSCWKGWRARGCAAADAFQAFEATVERTVATAGGTPAGAVVGLNVNNNETVVTALGTVTRIREPVGVVSVQSLKKMRKGKCRWMSYIQGGNGNDTYDTKKFVQLSPTSPAIVAGPWDGTTVPTSA